MAENIENNGCSQRDNAEHEGYVKASRSFNRIWKERDSAQPRLLEAILYKDNFNRAYKRVKANKGAQELLGAPLGRPFHIKGNQQKIYSFYFSSIGFLVGSPISLTVTVFILFSVSPHSAL